MTPRNVQARPITKAEAKRRDRAGVRPGRGSAGNGRSSLVWCEPPRNGLPNFKPYVYRGAG